jgi:hypothetical protein
MVMTIGELHTGHCIDQSLAGAVSECNEIRCTERLCTRDWEAQRQPNRMDNTLVPVNFRLHLAHRVRERIALSGHSPRHWTTPASTPRASGLRTGSRSRSPDQQVT